MKKINLTDTATVLNLVLGIIVLISWLANSLQTFLYQPYIYKYSYIINVASLCVGIGYMYSVFFGCTMIRKWLDYTAAGLLVYMAILTIEKLRIHVGAYMFLVLVLVILIFKWLAESKSKNNV